MAHIAAIGEVMVELAPFPTADSNIYIRLYYHTDVAVRESKYLQFALSGAGKDFSEIATNSSVFGQSPSIEKTDSVTM